MTHRDQYRKAYGHYAGDAIYDAKLRLMLAHRHGDQADQAEARHVYDTLRNTYPKLLQPKPTKRFSLKRETMVGQGKAWLGWA